MPRTRSALISCGLVLLLMSGEATYSYAQSHAKTEQLTVNVPPGKYEMPFFGSSNQKLISAKVTFSKLHTQSRWAPSAFVGFQSADGRTQIKAFLTQHNPGDTTLLAGYQLVVDGVDQTPKLLIKNIPQQKAVALTANRTSGGGVQIQVAGSSPVVIGSSTSELMPFIGLSSVVADVTWSVQ